MRALYKCATVRETVFGPENSVGSANFTADASRVRVSEISFSLPNSKVFDFSNNLLAQPPTMGQNRLICGCRSFARKSCRSFGHKNCDSGGCGCRRFAYESYRQDSQLLGALKSTWTAKKISPPTRPKPRQHASCRSFSESATQTRRRGPRRQVRR